MGKNNSKSKARVTRSLDMKESMQTLYGCETLFNDISQMTEFKKKETNSFNKNEKNMMRSPLVRFSVRRPKPTTFQSEGTSDFNPEFNRDNLELLELTKSHLKKSLEKKLVGKKVEKKKKTITDEYVKSMKKQTDWNLDQNFEQELISPRLFLNKNASETPAAELQLQEDNFPHKKNVVGLGHDELLKLYKENRRHIKSSGTMSYVSGDIDTFKPKGLKQTRPSNMAAQSSEDVKEKEPRRRIKKLETQTYNDMEKFKKFTSSINSLIGNSAPKPLPRIKIRGTSQEFLKEGGVKIVSSSVMERVVEVMVTEEKLEESEINKNLLSNLIQNKIKPAEFVLGDKEKYLHTIQEKYQNLHTKKKNQFYPDFENLAKSKKDMKLMFNFPSEAELKHALAKKNQVNIPEVPISPFIQKKRREGQNFSRNAKDKRSKSQGQTQGLTLKALAKGVIALNFWDRLMKKKDESIDKKSLAEKEVPQSLEKIEIISHLDQSERSPSNSFLRTPVVGSRKNSAVPDHLKPEAHSSVYLSPTKKNKKFSFLNILSPRNIETLASKHKDGEPPQQQKPNPSPRNIFGSFLLALSPSSKKSSVRFPAQPEAPENRGLLSPQKKSD